MCRVPEPAPSWRHIQEGTNSTTRVAWKDCLHHCVFIPHCSALATESTDTRLGWLQVPVSEVPPILSFPLFETRKHLPRQIDALSSILPPTRLALVIESRSLSCRPLSSFISRPELVPETDLVVRRHCLLVLVCRCPCCSCSNLRRFLLPPPQLTVSLIVGRPSLPPPCFFGYNTPLIDVACRLSCPPPSIYYLELTNCSSAL